MEKELIDKNVEILISFARGMREVGAIPVIYKGKLLEIDENYYKIHVWDSELSLSGVIGIVPTIASSGIILFKKEYIIYIKEI